MRAFDEGNLRAGTEEFLSAENTDWHRLGFKSPAFEDNQDANYFAIDAWEEAFADLEDFCEGTDPLLVIPSIPGSGKSTFLHEFMAQQQDPTSLHYLKARSIFSLRHLLNAISENFQQSRHVSTNTDKFINEMRATARESGPQLLIVDDAQRLSKETLAGLLQIVASQDLSDLWLRVVLCGEPQLEDRVQSLFEELEFAFSFNAIILDSLDINDTRAYLKHRLDEAGFSGKFPFSKSMVKHIHTLSSGFPGRINRVAQQVLIDMAKNHEWETNNTPSFFAAMAKHKIKAISLLMLVFAGYVLWYFQQGNPAQTMQNQIITIPVASTQKPDIKFPFLEKQNISLSEQKTLQNKPLNHPKEKLKPISITIKEEATPAKPQVNSQNNALPKGFTIQLLGVHDKNRLMEYMKQQHLGDQAAYYETRLKGHAWFVLTYGQFNSAQAAHDAIKTLPQNIQAKNPWVKPLAAINAPLIR